jgi:hypothetical protein
MVLCSHTNASLISEKEQDVENIKSAADSLI